MKNKSKTWIIVLVIVLIVMLPIMIDYFGSVKIEKITYDKYLDIVKNGENALVYVGDLDNDSFKQDVASTLKNVEKKGTKSDYASDYSIYSIDSTDLTKEELNKIGTDTGYVFLVAGDNQKVLAEDSKEKTLINSVDAYYNATFNNDNKSYKVLNTADEYSKLVKSKNITVAVFGRDTCYYCNIFKPVYNAVAEKYNLDIYYFDSDSYDASEYKKIMDLGLKIPAQCNSSGKESLLSDGFGTPLTIITQKGKTIDCISGYTDRSSLITKLQSHDLIK